MSKTPEWESIELSREPLVTMEDIAVTRDLVVGSLYEAARTRRSSIERRWQGFSIYDRGTEGGAYGDVYDGSEDHYLSCAVREVTPDQMRMHISILSMAMTEATAGSNERELYLFDWLESNGNRMAWGQTNVLHTDADGDQQRTIAGIHQVTTEECVALRERMVALAERVQSAA